MTHPISVPLPALRLAGLDVFPVPVEGRRMFCLRDRSEPGGAPLLVSEAALLLACLLNGERTLGDLDAAFLLQTGSRLPQSEIAAFIERLDEAGLLDSQRYRARLAQQRLKFAELRERPAIHAGGAYPQAPDEVVPFLDALFVVPDGPGAPPGPADGRFARALIAPHIDLHRGGPAYAWTYRALAECEPADLYVLLGTCHTPMRTPLAATRKAFATPLGPVPVDHAFLDALEAEYPGDLYEDEFSHRGEHSLEFQALYLRYLGRAGGSAGAAIVPLLCGSLHEWSAPDASPGSRPEVAAAVEALRRTLDRCERRVCLIAGADLAHVGPQFGDPAPVTSAVSEVVARQDAEMLEHICHGEAEGFCQQVLADGDARRICGLSPIYYLLALVGPAEGRLLTYSQWVDPRGQGSVTFAGVIFEQ